MSRHSRATTRPLPARTFLDDHRPLINQFAITAELAVVRAWNKIIQEIRRFS